MKILIVIPARGGSKGIPRKNIRMMGKKPLIYYSIRNAQACIGEFEDVDVVVDTDDDEIAKVAAQYGVYVVMRPQDLAQDHVTLDPVIYHAIIKMEKEKNKKYNIIVTMQPTSPTLKEKSIINAIKEFVKSKSDTMISVINHPHLSWKVKDDKMIANYEKRLNRQQLPGHFMETGAFLISKRDCCIENTRIGKNVTVYELDEQEGIDIDSETDWILCESILKRKKIFIRADGEKEIGMGHIYRSITLAFLLIGHDITIITKSSCELGVKKLKSVYLPIKEINSESDFFDILKEEKPDIVINDVLNTNKAYMMEIRKYTNRIVNFEDIGKGADLADAVINALYEGESINNRYNGFKYYCIRDEFLETEKKSFSKHVKNILIMFGGSDPSNLSKRLYDVCKILHEYDKEVVFHFVTGLGYQYQLEDALDYNIYVHRDVMRVSEFMAQADLAVTSQGRTIYELAYMGIPSIVLAQNHRETQHLFATLTNGFINLGIGKEQDDFVIYNTIKWLMDTPTVRKEMRTALLEKDFTKGYKRVKSIILDE